MKLPGRERFHAADLPGRRTPSYVLPSWCRPGCRWASLDAPRSRRPAAETEPRCSEPIASGPLDLRVDLGGSPQGRDTAPASSSWPGSLHPASFSSCASVSLRFDHLGKSRSGFQGSPSGSTGRDPFTTDKMIYRGGGRLLSSAASGPPSPPSPVYSSSSACCCCPPRSRPEDVNGLFRGEPRAATPEEPPSHLFFCLFVDFAPLFGAQTFDCCLAT